MSEYHAVQTQYKDKDALLEALGDVGYKTVEYHEEAQPMHDWHGRQTTYLDKTGDKANIIIRRRHIGGLANDVGFKRQADGTYAAIISEYDSSRHNANWLLGLKKSYTEKVLVKTAAKSGFKYLGKKMVGKKLQMQWLDTRA